MKLPVRVTKFNDETTRGYVWRVAMKNGFLSIRRLLSALGAPAVWWSNKRWDLIFDEVEGFASSPTRNFEPANSVNSLSLPSGVQDPLIEKIRFCPLCLMEGRYFKTDWERPSVTTCNVHHIKLLHQCPSCGEAFEWEHSLMTGCKACGFSWQLLNFKKVQNRDYRMRRESLRPYRGFDAYYCQALIHAYRPLSVELETARRIDLDLDKLPEIAEQALRFMTDPELLSNFRSSRVVKYNSLKLEVFPWFSVVGALQAQPVRHFYARKTLLPDYQRGNFSAADMLLTVEIITATKLLGLDVLWNVKMQDHQKPHEMHYEVRQKIAPALTRLGIKPRAKANKVFWHRYHLKDLHAFADHFSLASVQQENDLIWIVPSSHLLNQHGLTYIDLLEAGQKGELQLYRRHMQGVSIVGAEVQVFHDWLWSRLKCKCSGSIATRDLYNILGLTPKYVHGFIEKGILSKDPEHSRGIVMCGKRKERKQLALDGESTFSFLKSIYAERFTTVEYWMPAEQGEEKQNMRK